MGRKKQKPGQRRRIINKPHLIPEWKLAFKFWSIRLGVLGSLVTSILIAWPDAALQAWGILPQDLKNHIPEKFVPLIGVGIFALSMLARVIQQTKLHKPEITVTEIRDHGQSEIELDGTDNQR